jgi:hypothetical protein
MHYISAAQIKQTQTNRRNQHDHFNRNRMAQSFRRWYRQHGGF